MGCVFFHTASNAVSHRQPVTDEMRKIWQKHDRRFVFKSDYAIVPHWFLVAIFASSGVLPWATRFKRQFSLRTLLIAITLIAMALGIFAIFD